MDMSFWSRETRRDSDTRTLRAVLLALIGVILVLASRRCFEAIAIDEVKLRKVRESSIGSDHIRGPD
jgi:hypothetical protein